MMKKVNKEPPGILTPTIEADRKVTDLSTKTTSELIELCNRQVKLLNNKPFISKLADKGEKIRTFHNKIVKAIEEKNDEEQTCRLFNDLKLASVDKQIIQDVEWEGKLKSKEQTYLDSDDDSEPEDVIHILSQSTAQEKIVKIIPPEKPILNAEDLIKIGEIPYVKYIVEKTELKTKPKTSGQFKPFKTTVSDVHNPEKEVLRKRHKHWEITAATPPPIVHGPAKLLPLEESLKLQKEYNIHLKEVEARHAAQKLLAKAGIKMPELPADIETFGTYREENSDDSEKSDDEGSDKEVHDDEPETGGVIFTVMK